jgi:transcriptional regulator with XRE-family HTH domain
MDEKFIYDQVGKRIRQARERAKKTQEELAQAIDMSRGSIANYEGGRQAVYLSDLYLIADFLDASIMDLIPTVEEIRAKSAPEVEKADNLGQVEKEEIKSFIKEISEKGG